jgi:GNAT superfamily N-acetyltransferase
VKVSADELRERHARSHERFYKVFANASEGGRTIMFDGAVIAALMPVLPHRSLPNGVTYRDPSMVGPVLGELASLYESAQITAWTVWVLPGDEHLGPILEAHGHKLDGTPELMGAVIGDCDLTPASEIAIDEGTLEEAGEINDVAWGNADPDYALLLRDLPADVHRYIARDDSGTAIGSTLAIHAKGDCYITFVSAHPDVRGRGVASDLMKAALRDALEAGCVTTTLEASAMGRSAYRRIGYKDLGALRMYEKRAD